VSQAGLLFISALTGGFLLAAPTVMALASQSGSRRARNPAHRNKHQGRMRIAYTGASLPLHLPCSPSGNFYRD
jgi:hypothetical protein